MSDLNPAIDGCTCLCHKQAGVVHFMACCGIGALPVTKVQHGDWTIYFDPPPIPVRNCDWHFAHKDYDGAPDACDMRYGHSGSVEECIREIEFIEDLESQSEAEERDPKTQMMPVWRAFALASLLAAKTETGWDLDKVHEAYQYAIGEPSK